MIIAILNQKGGVGKTTTAVTLADAAGRAGLSTLLIDLDAQGNCADALGLEKGPDLYNLLIGNWQLEQCSMQARANLSLVRSNATTLKAENVIQAGDWKEYVLANALEGHPYDLVILDCAPSAHVLHIAALVASDYVIIPTELSNLSTLGVTEVESTLSQARRMTSTNCKILSILPTRMNRARNESGAQYSNLVDIYPGLVWPAIPIDAKIEVAQRRGKTLFEFAPLTPALVGYKIRGQHYGGYNQAYQLLAERI